MSNDASTLGGCGDSDMEFIEYYQLLRRYVWAPLLLMVVAALGGVLVYFLGPTVWKASGQILAQPGSAYRLRWAGATVEVTEEAEVWGTIQQLVESRALAEQAAQEAGLRDAHLQPLGFERDKRGNIFAIKGSAETADIAQRYVNGGMAALAKIWDQTRMDRTQAIRTEIQDRLGRLTPDRDRLLAEMRRLEAGPPPGPPTEAAVAVQSELTQVNGAIGTTAVDVEAARDRLSALSVLAQRESRARPEQQANPVLVSLRTRLSDLQTQRRRMLQTRTENHPEVVALDEDIQATRAELRRAEAQVQALGTTTALEQQLVLARADVQAAQRRVQELRARQAALQGRLAELQGRANAYRRLSDELAPADDERKTLLTNLKVANNEIDRLRTSQDLRVIEPARATESNRTPARLAMLVVGCGVAGLVLGVVLVFVLHYLQVAGNNRPAAASVKA